MVFWKKGFDGASLPDLTKAMRINRPSLYATFGNKEALFRKALDRYVTGPASFVREALDLPTARAVAQNVLRGTLLLLTDPDHPRGCLIVQAALACGDTSRCIQKELVAKREAGVIALRKRFERAIKERDLPASADPADLARYLATIIHGMSVEAASGAGRAKLQRVVDLAMRAWPN
jgi:AcrR family transcriptional regulator